MLILLFFIFYFLLFYFQGKLTSPLSPQTITHIVWVVYSKGIVSQSNNARFRNRGVSSEGGTECPGKSPAEASLAEEGKAQVSRDTGQTRSSATRYAKDPKVQEGARLQQRLVRGVVPLSPFKNVQYDAGIG